MAKFLIGLFSDFFRLYFSAKNCHNGFAFIVHPRDYNDMVSNLPFLRFFPKNFVFNTFSLLWPFTVSEITGLKSLADGRELKGWVIGVPMFAHQMLERREIARKRIERAIRLARNKGARVVGLGGLTGSIVDGGAGLSKKNGIIITAGRAYTSFTIKGYLEDVIRKMGLKKKNLTVAVVGAAGGVGRAVSKLITFESFKKVILIDLERKLKDLMENELLDKSNIDITHQISRAREADIIITATNAPEAVLESDDIKPGAIIIDDAQPSDISPEVINTREDIIVIEAGVIVTDGVHVGTKFRLANRHETYCCLGEVMAITASDWEGEYNPWDITREAVDAISGFANKAGFKLAPYQAFGRIVPESRIIKVKKIMKNSINNL